MRSALVWLGCADPLDTVRDVCDDDPERAATAAVLEAWPTELTHYSVAELIDAARATDIQGSVWPAWLDAITPIARDKRGNLDAVVLGNWLRDHKTAVVGKLKLVRVGSKTRPSWAVEKRP